MKNFILIALLAVSTTAMAQVKVDSLSRLLIGTPEKIVGNSTLKSLQPA